MPCGIASRRIQQCNARPVGHITIIGQPHRQGLPRGPNVGLVAPDRASGEQRRRRLPDCACVRFDPKRGNLPVRVE